MSTLTSTWGGALRIVGVALLLVCQAAGAQSPEAAPLNPEFVSWLEGEAVSDLAMREAVGASGYGLGHIPPPVDLTHAQYETATLLRESVAAALPTSFDLRLEGDVTSVKDQGSCGSCWAFATYGSLESWVLRNDGEVWDFSENNLKNYHGLDWGPCEGGNTFLSMAYLARWAGPVDEADDPYNDYDDRPSPGGPSQKYLESARYFFTVEDIKNALMTYGGLYVSLYWNSAYYNSGDYTYYYSGGSSTNHGVTLVGWDDEMAVDGAPSDGAWICKNSWGSGWGDNGYFYISYDDARAVTYATAFCYAVPPESYVTNYQYDPLGWCSEVGYGSSTCWAANIFSPEADERLAAVGLYAVDNNVSYQIYVYDTFNGTSFSDLLGSTSGVMSDMGYYTIPLPDLIDLTTDDEFAVVVKFTTTGYTFPVAMEKDYAGYSSDATANPGESYLSSTGSNFTDITLYSGFGNTNVCIKALTIASAPTFTGTPDEYTYVLESNGDVTITDTVSARDGVTTLTPVGTPDVIFAGVTYNFIVGTNSYDEIMGTSEPDLMLGFDGMDTFWAGAGDDYLFGGDGRDVLGGEDGDDWLSGEADDDRLHAGEGNDTCYGGAGEDYVFLKDVDGTDVLEGGEGTRDVLKINDPSYTSYSLTGSHGFERFVGGVGDDTVDWADATGATQMNGNGGNDQLSGGPFRDILRGGDGDDTLSGGANNAGQRDLLYGDDGEDALYVFGGNTNCYGGLGADTAWFTGDPNDPNEYRNRWYPATGRGSICDLVADRDYDNYLVDVEAIAH